MAGGVFQEAYSVVNAVDQIVQTRIEEATATANALQNTALSTIGALSSTRITFGAANSPKIPDVDPNISVELTLPAITPTSFGAITSQIPEAPALYDAPDITDLDIPDFNPHISSFNIPQAPAWVEPGDAPARPVIGTVTLPTAPTVALPSLPILLDINVPTFDGVGLPVFNAQAPEFEGTALPGILQWTEPSYRTTILEEMMAKVRTLWSGGSGIPPAVERAMVERALSREDMIANRAIDEVAGEFSQRGFTMPTGMQAARVDQMQQELALKKLGMNRELAIEFAKFQIENIRFGVGQAIAAENVLVNLFTNMADRMFQAAKYQVESQINIYNMQVTLFNARTTAYQTAAQVFDIRVKAALADIEVFRAEIEAEVARGQLNEQKVRTYTAQVQAVLTGVEVFKSQMQGAQVESDVIRNRIEAYKADVQAYAERIGAEKIRFEAYESQVRGEVAKAGIIDSEARAYAALVQGKAAAADVDIKHAELVIQKNRVLIEAFAASLEAERTRMQSQTAVVQAGAQAYIADTQRYAAQAGAETAKAQTIVSAKEASQRTAIAFYTAQVQSYLGNMAQMTAQAGLVVESLKSAGQIASTLAAGAMAGVNVGANLSANGGVSASGSDSSSQSISESRSENRNFNFEGTE
jgi:hypothetical protein